MSSLLTMSTVLTTVLAAFLTCKSTILERFLASKRALRRSEALLAAFLTCKSTLLARFLAPDQFSGADRLFWHNVLVASTALADPLCYMIGSATDSRSIDR